MRICSFLPSATEIVYALGLEKNLVGITHECDYPPEVSEKPRVIDSFLKPDELNSKEIDELVAKNKEQGKSTYLIELEKLKEASPDIIITQGLCEVCAVSGNEVIDAAKALGSMPDIISLEPKTVGEILESFITVGVATNKKAEAEELCDKLNIRLDSIKRKLEIEDEHPKVFCQEWFHLRCSGKMCSGAFPDLQSLCLAVMTLIKVLMKWILCFQWSSGTSCLQPGKAMHTLWMQIHIFPDPAQG